MSARITAIGLARPEHEMAQDAARALMVASHSLDSRGERRLRALYRGSRIDSRATVLAAPDSGALGRHLRAPRDAPAPTTSDRMAVYRAEALPLAERACRAALSSPGAPAADRIDHLIVASCTGFLAPGLDVLLARALSLRSDVGRTLVGFQGCHAGLTSLRLAADIARARPCSSVMIACVELCSIHFQTEATDDNLLANALFADGAAAVIVSGPDAKTRRAPVAMIENAATHLAEGTLDDMTWSIGDFGFEMHLSSYVPRLVARDLRSFASHELALDAATAQRAHWAVHPGGSAILDAVSRALELPADALAASRAVLARCGNMSSPTIFFVLDELMRSGATGPAVALAFGPGLTVEAARLDLRK